MKRARWFLLGLLFMLGSGAALAHKPSDSYLHPHACRAAARARRPLGHRAARPGLRAAAWTPTTTATSPGARCARAARDIAAYALARLEAVGQATQRLRTRAARAAWSTSTPTAPTRCCASRADCPRAGRRSRSRYSLLFDVDPQHRGLLSVTAAGARPAGAGARPRLRRQST